MHDGMLCDPIQGQGQGHGASEVLKIALFRSTPPSRPNDIRGGNVRPSVGTSILCTYICTSLHKKFVRFQ